MCWSSWFSSNRDSSLKTIRLQSDTFHTDQSRHHCNLCRRCVVPCGKRRNGSRNRRFRSRNRRLMVWVGTAVLVTRRMVASDESCAVTAAPAIHRSSRAVAPLGCPLSSCIGLLPVSTHSRWHRLIDALLRPKCPAIRRYVHLASHSPMVRHLSNTVLWL